MKAKGTKAKSKASKAKPTGPRSKKPAARTAKAKAPIRKPPARPAAKPVAAAVSKPPSPAAAQAPRPSRAAPPLSPERRLALIATRRRQFQHHRDLLLQKQRELMEAYAVTRGDSRGNLDDGTEDYIDYAVHSYAREFLLSLTELDRKQLLLVEEALRRIDRGEFGRCLQCGEEINARRLEVAPGARYCVRCQELEERGLLPQAPPGGEEDFAEGVEDEAEGEATAEAEILESGSESDEDDEDLGEERLPGAGDEDEEE